MTPEAQRLVRSQALRNIDSYAAALDAGSAAKWHVISRWLTWWPGATLVDMGCGTGALAARLAGHCRGVQVSGIDAAPALQRLASRRFGSVPRLRFLPGCATRQHFQGVATMVMSSLLHEVFSHADDGLAAVSAALRAAFDSLAPGGRLIIRDFVRPEAGETGVMLVQRRSDHCAAHDLRALVSAAAQDAERADTPHLVCRSHVLRRNHVIFETDAATAYEYLFRIGQGSAEWRAELRERYGFWTLAQALALLRGTGFELVAQQALPNHWVARHRLAGRVHWALGRHAVHCLPAQWLLVAQRPGARSS